MKSLMDRPKLWEIAVFHHPWTDYIFQWKIIGVKHYLDGDVWYMVEWRQWGEVSLNIITNKK